MVFYANRSLSLLNPWLIRLYSDTSNQIDSLEMGVLLSVSNTSLYKLFLAEQIMANLTTERMQFESAEGHCQRCLIYAKRYGLEGKEKTNMMFEALIYYYVLRQRQFDSPKKVYFAEE